MAEDTTPLLGHALLHLPIDFSSDTTRHYLQPEVVVSALGNIDTTGWGEAEHDRLDEIINAYLAGDSRQHSAHWLDRSAMSKYAEICKTHFEETATPPSATRLETILSILAARGSYDNRLVRAIYPVLLAAAGNVPHAPSWLIQVTLRLEHYSFTTAFEDTGGPADLLVRVAEAEHERTIEGSSWFTTDIARHTTDPDLLDYCLTHPSLSVARSGFENPTATPEHLLRAMSMSENDSRKGVRVTYAIKHPSANTEVHRQAAEWIISHAFPRGDMSSAADLCSGPYAEDFAAAASGLPVNQRAVYTAALLSSRAPVDTKEAWLDAHADAAKVLTESPSMHQHRRVVAIEVSRGATVSPRTLGFMAGFITTTATSKYDREWEAWKIIIEHPLTPLDALRPFSKGSSLPSTAIRKRIKTETQSAHAVSSGDGKAESPSTPSARQRALLQVRDTSSAVFYLSTYGVGGVDGYVSALADVLTSPASLPVRREVATILTDMLNHNPHLAVHADSDKSGSAFKAMGRFRDPLHFTAATLTHLATMVDHPAIVDFAGKQLGKALTRAA